MHIDFTLGIVDQNSHTSVEKILAADFLARETASNDIAFVYNIDHLNWRFHGLASAPNGGSKRGIPLPSRSRLVRLPSATMIDSRLALALPISSLMTV